MISSTINATQWANYNKQCNRYAYIREYLIDLILYFDVTTIEHIQFQASTLAQLTESTNQLTRQTIVGVRRYVHLVVIVY
jgi:hypothetical protein